MLFEKQDLKQQVNNSPIKQHRCLKELSRKY